MRIINHHFYNSLLRVFPMCNLRDNMLSPRPQKNLFQTGLSYNNHSSPKPPGSIIKLFVLAGVPFPTHLHYKLILWKHFLLASIFSPWVSQGGNIYTFFKYITLTRRFYVYIYKLTLRLTCKPRSISLRFRKFTRPQDHGTFSAKIPCNVSLKVC